MGRGRVPKVERVCIICGKHFLKAACYIRRGDAAIFCSNGCRKIGQRQNPPGKGKPHPWTAELNRARTKWTEPYTRQFLDEYKAFRGGLRGFIKTKGINTYQMMLGAFTKWFPDEWEMIAELKKGNSWRYRNGRQFEYRVKAHLKKEGYFVLRSAGSRSPADLVAVKTGSVLFVQCKVDGTFHHVKEKRELIELAHSVGATPVLAWRKGAPHFQIVLESLK